MERLCHVEREWPLARKSLFSEVDADPSEPIHLAFKVEVGEPTGEFVLETRISARPNGPFDLREERATAEWTARARELA